MKTIVELESERLEWSLKTFPDANPISSLDKLRDEINEVEKELSVPYDHVNIEDATEEYADCLMCLFDSAGRANITPQQIFDAFEKKLAKNKARVWKNNGNNTYSHVK